MRAGALALLTALAPMGLGCGGSSADGSFGDLDDAGIQRDGATAADADGSDGHETDAGSSGPNPSTPDAGQERLGPPYPIILAHGFFGFDTLFGLVDYWWQIPETLEAAGETHIFVTTVDPFNGSNVRGAQLISQTEDILAYTGHAKVNLIGHSQGGLDARVVAHERPDLVASATSIATPHQGSEVADLVETLLALVDGDDTLVDMVNALLALFGPIAWDMIDSGSDISAGLNLFSQSGIAEFNATYTDDPDVRYYSVTGVSGPAHDLTSPETGPCAVPNPPAFVSKWYGERDPIDPLLALTEGWLATDTGLAGYLLGLRDRDQYRNDGLVRATSGQWGRFLGCVPADHLDQVGQLFGADPGCYTYWNGWRFTSGCNGFDHLEFYLDLVDFLRAEGF
jgi:triacylglycerol lipase